MSTHRLSAPVAFAAALLLGSGCPSSPAPVGCDPACAAGESCDEATNTCLPAALPDLSAPAGDDLALDGCNPPCLAPTAHCNAQKQCVACLEDAHCPAGQVCRTTALGASCLPGCADDARCPMGQRCCDSACVDTSKDPMHCGGCRLACRGAHARSSCVAGQCSLGGCDSGWGDCNADPADGCEASLRADPRNCSACGAECKIANAIPGCSNGCYLAACVFGFDDCNANEMDGCETSVTSDVRNCGACGKSCGAPAQASTVCTAGVCQIKSCNKGYDDCNRTFADGCETNLNTTAQHCGACGKACAQGLVCKDGSCTCPNCNLANAKSACVDFKCVIDQCFPNFGDCDANPVNGCERPLGNDVNNCGACANVCEKGLVCILGACTCPQCNIPNSKTKCVNNQCVFDSCLPGFGNCDGNEQNGCEADFQKDDKNCTACGKACPGNQHCVGGVCIACDMQREVSFNGHCYYLDGSAGQCDQGYALAHQNVFNDIAKMFVGKTYKNKKSDNCCITNADVDQDWGMEGQDCNGAGPFVRGPVPGGAGCTNQNNRNPSQLTFCGN